MRVALVVRLDLRGRPHGVARAHEDRIARPDGRAGEPLSSLEVRDADAIAGLEMCHAARPGHIEQDATRHDRSLPERRDRPERQAVRPSHVVATLAAPGASLEVDVAGRVHVRHLVAVDSGA